MSMGGVDFRVVKQRVHDPKIDTINFLSFFGTERFQPDPLLYKLTGKGKLFKWTNR